MLSDCRQLVHSIREYAIVGMILDDISKKVVDLILVVSSRFGIGKRFLIPGAGSSCRRLADLADR